MSINQYSEAIREAYSICPSGETLVDTLEIRHPDKESIFIVRDHIEFTACLETGQWVDFQPFNHGNKNAVKMLQRAVGVTDDGVIGNQTLAAVAKMDKNDVLMKFNAERIEFFCNIGTFNVFGKGWMRRVAGNLRWAAVDN